MQSKNESNAGFICAQVLNQTISRMHYKREVKIATNLPELKSKLPTLWTRSYYCESVGHISEDSIRKYIEDQKNK